jgi:alpha-glucosidase
VVSPDTFGAVETSDELIRNEGDIVPLNAIHNECHARVFGVLGMWNHLRVVAVPMVALLFSWQSCFGLSLQSPDGKVRLDTRLVASHEKSTLVYSVNFDGTPVIGESAITFKSADGSTIGEHLRMTSQRKTDVHESEWKPVYGERSTIIDKYNRLRLDFVDGVSGHQLQIEFRCYDAGIAFQINLVASETDPNIQIAQEQTEFRFHGDHTARCAFAPQDNYYKRRLSKIQGPVQCPLTIKLDEHLYAAIAEAGLVDYAVMKLRRAKQDPNCLVSQIGSDVQAERQLRTPWRVVMLGKSPGELLENNDLILNLSEPCAIADTSWIKPGKALRDVTLSTNGAKACVDFAAKHNLQYVELDAGWYGPENDDASDATTVAVDKSRSNGRLDLPHVIEYASERGIGIILYVNRRALERQLDEILPLYKSWGVKGVKYGFVQTGSQHWTAWLHEAVRKAAEQQLMVDVHDNYRPTGYSRTYPNLMSQEGVRGDEATPTGSQAITTLFTRNLAGAADHTICYFDPRVSKNWTHGHQLAKAVCTYSPWQFIYWYDSPLTRPDGTQQNSLVETPELDFFDQVPTVWDDTRVIQGDIGKYAVIARRSGQDWFVGAMNADQKRELTVPLDFLSRGHRYKARLYGDDLDMDTATRVRIDEKFVDADSRLQVSLLPNGGQAMWLTPVEPVVAAADKGLPHSRHTASVTADAHTE